MNRELICRCEEVTREEIIEAIRAGHHTVKSIKKATRAGMGACQGRTCGRLIRQMLVIEGVEQDKARTIDKNRFPLIPVPLSSLNWEGEDHE